MQWSKRIREFLVSRVLGLEDTPHRIAVGMLLGTIVAWTPTLGFQIGIYLAIATLLRANKISGIPILFISNPVTAVPLYYFCWRVGHALMHGGAASDEEGLAIISRLEEAGRADEIAWHELLTAELWASVWDALVAMGVELWVGSLTIGLLTAGPSYFITRWAIRAYRRSTNSDD